MDKLVLEALEERGSLETFEFAKELGKDHQAIVGSVKSIHALGDVSDMNVHCIPVCYLGHAGADPHWFPPFYGNRSDLKI